MSKRVNVLGIPCLVLIDKVPAEFAHPDEGMTGICESCKVVLHPVLFTPTLVWGFGNVGDFTVSRHDSQFPLSRNIIDR